MLLARRRPFWDLEKTFEDFNRMFETFERPLGLRSVPWGTFPAVNLYDREDRYVMSVEIPGINVKDIDLTVVENTVTLSGRREPEKNAENMKYYRKERPFGEFKRTISLNEKVDPDKVNAEYKDGILTVELPKIEKAQAKSITIKAS